MNLDLSAVIAGTGAFVACFGLIGGWVFRLSGRLAQADAKADAAAKEASIAALTNAALRVALDTTDRELNDHRIHVAKEYVSSSTIASLEDKLIKAIDRLGDRLDNLLATRPLSPVEHRK